MESWVYLLGLNICCMSVCWLYSQSIRFLNKEFGLKRGFARTHTKKKRTKDRIKYTQWHQNGNKGTINRVLLTQTRVDDHTVFHTSDRLNMNFAVPNARYQHPMAPITAIIGGCVLISCGGVAEGEGKSHSSDTIRLGSDVLSRPPTHTAKLMVTVGFPSSNVSIETALASCYSGQISPAPWTTAGGSLRVMIEGHPNGPVPLSLYPKTSAHPAAARSFAMLDVTEPSREQFCSSGSVSIIVGYEQSPAVAVVQRKLPPFAVVFLACWCEPISADLIINDAIRLARAAAHSLSMASRTNNNGQSSGAASGSGGGFPLAGSGLPFALSTQQQLAAASVRCGQQQPSCAEVHTIDDDDDDGVTFVGSNNTGTTGAAIASSSTSAPFGGGQVQNRFVLLPSNPIVSRVEVSFRCPITYCLMSVPGKGAHCAHFNGFDISTYVKHCLNATNAWNCPLCNAEVRHTDIVVCTAIEEAMYSYGVLTEEEDCDSCFLLVDTSNAVLGPQVIGWEPCEEAVEQLRRREVDDEDGDENDEDFDRHRSARATKRR